VVNPERGGHLRHRFDPSSRVAGCDNVGVASDEILSEIKTHIARGNELMEAIRREHELNRGSWERQLHLTRRVIAHNERAFNESVGVMQEMRAEIRAQTEAIFRVIDRLDGGGTEPAGA